MPVLHHIALAAATLALGLSGLRLASLVAPRGLERVLSAAVLAVATAVGEVLLLGLLGLGGSSIALTGTAGLTWIASLRLPAPELPVRAELASWGARRTLRQRIVAGAVLGTWLACQAWLLRYPTLGLDSVLYHVSEAVLWVGNGHTGGTDLVFRTLPVTNYPISEEVFLSWGLGISHSFVPASLVVPAQIALLGVAAWSGLRALGVRRLPRGLGTAAACAMPAVIAWQSNGALTDPAAVSWLLTCAALCAAARPRPALLAPALVAGGLALGTKTTTGPLVVASLLAAGWLCRRQLRSVWKALAAAALFALGCGGVWYVRNLFQHGSPLWPFLSTSWGTPLPRPISQISTAFADAPRETIRFVGDLYLERFLGGIVLLVGGLLAPVLAPRRRAVWIASGAAVLSFVIWARAPFTGVPPELRIPEAVFSTTRYLTPAVAAAIVAVALAGGGRGRRARVAQVVLGAGLAIELVQVFRLGYPTVPSPVTPLAGALLGAAAVAAGAVLSRRVSPPARPGSRPVLVTAVLVLGALLAVPAAGYTARHAEARVYASGLVDWMSRRPDDSAPVSSAPGVIGPLSGDRLARRLEPIPRGTGCAALRERARTEYVVLNIGAGSDANVRALTRCLPKPPDYRDAFFRAWAPRP